MEVKFNDLIRTGKIPDLAEKFQRIIDIPIAISDINGNELCSFGRSDICRRFLKTHPDTQKNCRKTLAQLKSLLLEKQKPVKRKCRNGLHHAAAPIVVAGRHLANFHTGSFFLEQPDKTFFTRQAEKYGFDKKQYLEAVKNTPVLSKNRLTAILAFLASLSDLVGTMYAEAASRQTTLKKLHDSETRYRDLVEHANSIILRKDPKGKITFFNEFAEKFFGFSKEEVLGKSTIETIVPETESTGRNLKQLVQKIMAAPAKYARNENENICKDGRRVWVSWTNKALTDPSGKFTELLCIGNDITSSKQNEFAVMQSKTFLEEIFHANLDGIIVCDAEGKIESVNRAIERILGYRAGELIGSPLSMITSPDETYYRIAVKAMEVLVEKGSINNLETMWARKDGSPCPVEINARLIKNPDGNLLRSINSVRDISKRKKAEETTEQLKKAIEQAAEIVIVIGVDGTIKYVNPAVEKITGYPAEKLIGTNPILGSKAKSDSQFYESLLTAINQGRPWTGHMSPIKPDGSTCELDVNLTPVRDSEGNITSYVSISRDVTNERKLENQLRQTQKMEAIGLLAGGIAHDFNNILGAVIGFTEMAHFDAPEDSPIKYNLEQVLESCVRAKNLVKQILAFSRQSKENRIPTYTHLIVKETIKLLRASLPATIEIHHNIENQEDMLLADATQIHQLIMNLCTNAAHAMRKKGGILTINLSSLTIDSMIKTLTAELEPGDYIKLTIADTGEGIRPDIIDRIFEPFFTTKAIGEGTGMGLTAVKTIVENHNGSISVSSNPGKGTTFHIFLPKIQGEVTHIPEEKNFVPPPEGNERILLVDDETLLVRVGKKMLSSLGYTVTTVTDSLEALDIFKKDPDRFDLVITDQTMPHLTGYDLSRKILKIRPNLPIILCTGYSESLSTRKARAAGIREYLLKPINRKEIAETVRSVLDRENQVPAPDGSRKTRS